MSMSGNMEKELTELKARVKEITDNMSESKKNAENAEMFVELVKQYIGITELDYELVHILIEKIYIYEREIIDGKASVKVDIYYRFIGNFVEEKPITVSRRR